MSGSVSLLLGAWIVIAPAEVSAGQTEFFESRIRPVFVEHCVSCHGAKKQKAGLRLDSRTSVLQGGENGPAVQPGDAEHSLLLLAVRQTGALKMPPKKKLPAQAIDDLVAW